jgi:hypothetical protein
MALTKKAEVVCHFPARNNMAFNDGDVLADYLGLEQVKQRTIA